jgi:hypothetical protein
VKKELLRGEVCNDGYYVAAVGHGAARDRGEK